MLHGPRAASPTVNIPPAASVVSGVGIVVPDAEWSHPADVGEAAMEDTMSTTHERNVTPRTARFLRELEGPHASSDHAVDTAWGSAPDPEEDHQLRAFPELVAAIALVGVVIIVLAAWQIGAFTSG
jgi:hypothetical protein